MPAEIQESVLDEHGVWHVVHHDEPPADQESAAIEDVHSKATKPTPEERLEKIKELNALEQLQVHEDYLYSGGLGRLSAQRDAQRNVCQRLNSAPQCIVAALLGFCLHWRQWRNALIVCYIMTSGLCSHGGGK